MMTDQQKILAAIEEVRRDVATLQTDVQKMSLAIVGDKIRKIDGMLDVLATHGVEIYGNQQTRHIGLKQGQELHSNRLVSLEGDRIKLIAIATAVSGTVTFIWGVAKHFLNR